MKKYVVRGSAFAFCLTIGSMIGITSLSRRIIEPQRQTHQARPLEGPSSVTEGVDVEVLASEILSSDEVAYHGYVVQKKFRKAKLDYLHDVGSRGELVDVSYAVLKRNGKVIARFDADIYSGLGNGTRFGVFSFLGGEEKQLFVSQDIPRGGNQWIVSLSPQPRVIYDGSEFKTGREGDDMSIIDVDQDGVYEIIQPITAFYSFNDLMSMSEIPLPAVIFKYDRKAKKYLLANLTFQDYYLRDIDEAKRNAAAQGVEAEHQSGVIEVVLDYIFAGKEAEAWAYYEESYKLRDKAALKQRIKKELRAQPVYRFMYPTNGLASVK